MGSDSPRITCPPQHLQFGGRRRPTTADASRSRPFPRPRPGGSGRSRDARCRISHDQDHAARPVHDVAPGEERVLQGRGRAGHGLRRRGQRRALAEGAVIVRRELRGGRVSDHGPNHQRTESGPQRTSMTLSPASTSASIEANSGVSHRTNAAREELPTLSQMMVGPCGSRGRRAARCSCFCQNGDALSSSISQTCASSASRNPTLTK